MKVVFPGGRRVPVRSVVALGALFLALVISVSAPQRALAETFTVKTTKNGGEGSLRQAILAANGRMGADEIRFRIDGSGVKTIRPRSPLPAITTDALTINGYTQRGASKNTLSAGTNAKLRIQIDGTSAGASASGLVIGAGADGSRISGLAINRFEQAGIVVNFAGSCSLDGNFIGTNAAGTADLGNGGAGVSLGGDTDANLIGGEFSNARNIISGNGGDGVLIDSNVADENAIQGNLIGTDAAGNAALGNGGAGIAFADGPRDTTVGGITEGARNVISGNGSHGVSIVATDAAVRGNFIGTDATGSSALRNEGSGIRLLSGGNNTIGGASSGSGNVISGNRDNGITIEGSENNQVLGNFIGTNAARSTRLGNSSSGVSIFNASGNNIGSTASGSGNVISGNTATGVLVSGNGATGNSILSNRIFGNGGLGIDLSGGNEDSLGVTANDGDNPLTPAVVDPDSDTGTNNLQNFPDIRSATRSGTALTVSGSLESAPRRGFTVQCYLVTSGTGEDHGEGSRLLGQTTVTTGPGGDADFTCSGTVSPSPIQPPVTATATDNLTGDTSEFSENVSVR